MHSSTWKWPTERRRVWCSRWSRPWQRSKNQACCLGRLPSPRPEPGPELELVLVHPSWHRPLCKYLKKAHGKYWKEGWSSSTLQNSTNILSTVQFYTSSYYLSLQFNLTSRQRSEIFVLDKMTPCQSWSVEWQSVTVTSCEGGGQRDTESVSCNHPEPESSAANSRHHAPATSYHLHSSPRTFVVL